MIHSAKLSLHIVSFDIPEPPDYGGAIDVYYKIKALSEAGCEIHLHCFEYGRQRSNILNQYCKKIYYYKRNTGLTGISLFIPYITYSRKNRQLLHNLCEVDCPILFEGLHCTYYLNHPKLRDRKKFVRTHNIEHQYYYQLAQKEKALSKKTYFYLESILLKKWETTALKNTTLFPISKADFEFFSSVYPKNIIQYIPPFHGVSEPKILVGTGTYCLYHGNLSHPENIEAASFLLNEVADSINMRIVFAGKKPTDGLINLSKLHPNTEVIANPTEQQINTLIQSAHIILLPTFQQSGMKLKLLYSLHLGRHIIPNAAMLYGTDLENKIKTAETAEEYIQSINNLCEQNFTKQDIYYRTELLAIFSNVTNANKIIQTITEKKPNLF
jgi:Glycosyl transferases group 1